MISRPRYPLLFQVNTRLRLSELGSVLGRPATLDDITDDELNLLAQDGFNLVWMLGVWQTGPAARQVSAADASMLAEYRHVLTDFRKRDVCGSCFAIQDYHVHTDFGGDAALARLRQRLRERGLGLILDFVPNHVGLDHHWLDEHPDFFIEGTKKNLAKEPKNYIRTKTAEGTRILAYGRDPYFSGWSDTLQLNHGNPAMQKALLGELKRISHQCDGVRCDMAMLILPEVFERTWGISPAPFWPQAIDAVQAEVPGFIFLAEVYWDLEWTLQQQGFDFAYDKRLYDRLVQGAALPIRQHLSAGLDYQDHLARFLENHDEQRAAAEFSKDVHRAAAVITYLTPGLRFFHMGQREGKRVRIPIQLKRGPAEAADEATSAFYDRLLACLRDPAFREGAWQLLEARPAWDGNDSHVAIIAFSWSGPEEKRRLVVVNYAAQQSQGYVGLPWNDLKGRTLQLHDRLGEIVYERNGTELTEHGLYLDLPSWGYHVFEVESPKDRA